MSSDCSISRTPLLGLRVSAQNYFPFPLVSALGFPGIFPRQTAVTTKKTA